MAGSALLGAAFVVAVPPGLPYDEPSHWDVVLHYVDERTMPVLGDLGVTYQAQMGPAAYALAATVAAPLRLLSEATAFYGVRALGVALHLLLTALVWRLVGRAAPRWPRAPLAAAVVIGLNPMLLAMSSSVQNDTLSLVLALAAVDVATSGRPRAPVLAGVLVGLALLTKLTVWPVLVVLAGRWLLHRRSFDALAFAATASVVSAWWFVRNAVLYGDVTARAGVAAAGFAFPPVDDASPLAFGRTAVTYLWLPTEYVRNTVSAPPAVDAVVLVLTAVGVVGASLTVARRRELSGSTTAVLLAVAALAVGGWVVTAATTQSVAPRVAYVALPAWGLIVGATSQRWRGMAVVALVVGQLVVAVWFLHAVSGLARQPFALSL